MKQMRLRVWIVILIACTCFAPGLGGGFVFDDKPNIVQNFGMRIAGIDHYSLWRAANSFPGSPGLRPLAMLTFALDFWLFGLNPLAFKLTNLLIHGLTAFFLTRLFGDLLVRGGWSSDRARKAGLALALAWAVHPLQVSSVLYVVQRMQTLGTLFLILALLAYLAARQAQAEGAPSRKYWIRCAVFWSLGLASKEDAILLPAFTLALELTLLRFRAASLPLAHGIRLGYAALVACGAAAFLLYVIPHYWVTAAYEGRNFNTLERLLTQTRVLMMYLGQIFWPLPSNLPFYYDDLEPSRSLWQPASTLWSLLALIGLLGWSWLWRKRRPVFALGVLLYLAAHSVTSNVVGLELAFEHRNHFALIGALLAMLDLVSALVGRLRLNPVVPLYVTVAFVAGSAVATAQRAHTWGEPLRLAEAGVVYAPESVRAWTALCRANYDRSHGKADDPYFDAAIISCDEAARFPDSASTLANVVILKTIKGTVEPQDWSRLLMRLESVTMNVENAGVAENLVMNSFRGTPLSEDGVAQVVEVVARRAPLSAQEYLRFGYYFLGRLQRPAQAEEYFQSALKAAPHDKLMADGLFAELRKYGHESLADRLELLAREDARGSSRAP